MGSLMLVPIAVSVELKQTDRIALSILDLMMVDFANVYTGI